MDVKMCWIQIKMGHPLAQHGVAPFRANGAHPSNYVATPYCTVASTAMELQLSCTPSPVPLAREDRNIET